MSPEGKRIIRKQVTDWCCPVDRADPRTVKQHLELAKELGTIRIEVDREVLIESLGVSAMVSEGNITSLSLRKR